MNGLYEAIRTKLLEDNEELVPQDELEDSAPPEVTVELATELAQTVGIEDVEAFSKGLQEELNKYEAVNKQLDVLAKIVAVNIGLIPDWYSRIEALKAAYEAEKAEGSEEAGSEDEPVAVIDNEEIVAEESIQAPIDSKPSAATAITAESKLKEGANTDDAAKEPASKIGQGGKRQLRGVPKKLDKFPESKQNEGKLDYTKIDTGDTEANLKALTEKLAIATQKVNELNSLIANARGDHQGTQDKPKDDVEVKSSLATDGLGKKIVDGGEVSKPANVVAAKDGKSLETEKGVEGLGNKEAGKVQEPLKRKLGGPGYTPKY